MKNEGMADDQKIAMKQLLKPLHHDSFIKAINDLYVNNPA